MDIKILTALHKPYPAPDDPAYLPVYVGSYGRKLAAECGASGDGAAGVEGEGAAAAESGGGGAAAVPAAQESVPRRPCAFDHTGINISDRNPYYCELTALYWGWKNLDCNCLGLVHYRRYFQGGYWWEEKDAGILSSGEMERIFAADPGPGLILPSKRHYGIETIESHFRHTHEPEALDLTREILRERYPDYMPAFEKAMKRRSAHMFNMMVARRDVCDAYCGWLFDILGELEGRLDLTGYSDFEARVYGRISEMLLDVWVDRNAVPFTEVPFVFLEDANWPRKIKRFLQAKYFHRKYRDSL